VQIEANYRSGAPGMKAPHKGGTLELASGALTFSAVFMDGMRPRHKDLVVVKLDDVLGISVGVARKWRGVAGWRPRSDHR
jgi:hypothetical protein